MTDDEYRNLVKWQREVVAICTPGEVSPDDNRLRIATITAHLQALNEAGFVVVPVEPTEAMVDARCDSGGPQLRKWRANVYSAMIEAAPE